MAARFPRRRSRGPVQVLGPCRRRPLRWPAVPLGSRGLTDPRPTRPGSEHDPTGRSGVPVPVRDDEVLFTERPVVLARQYWELSTSGGGAALASTRGSRTSAASGDIRDGSGNCGPACQVLGAEIWPFPASRTRPVTVRAAGPSSQAITGATCSAASGSSPGLAPGLAGASPSHSVRRVRATGATALTVAPYRPSSSAPTRASMATPALAAL